MDAGVWFSVGVSIILVALGGCVDEGDRNDGADGPETSPEPGAGSNDTQDRPPLPQTEWSFDPSPGCEGSTTGQGSCASFAGGPEASGIDGYWLELGEVYWGRNFTSTIEQPDGGVDSDCYFVASDETTIIADANQGGDPCSGTVVEDTAWLFLYSYQVPHLGMTLTFEE